MENASESSFKRYTEELKNDFKQEFKLLREEYKCDFKSRDKCS